MLFGAGFYSFTIGSLSGVFANLETRYFLKLVYVIFYIRQAHLESKVSAVEEFSKEAKLSRDLQGRLKASLEYNSLKSIFS